MSLAKKYNISQETVNNMVKDGWLSCTVPSYEKIYNEFKETMRMGGSCKTRVIYDIADKNRVSEATVRSIIVKFES